MKSRIIFCALLCLALLNGQARAADCDEAKNPEDSDFKHFFKSISCKVKQGAEDVADAAKPYTDKIGEGAKELGSSVVEKYKELKHRLTDDASTPKSTLVAQVDAPTERVPLAPIAPTVPAEIMGNAQPIAG